MGTTYLIPFIRRFYQKNKFWRFYFKVISVEHIFKPCRLAKCRFYPLDEIIFFFSLILGDIFPILDAQAFDF